MVMHARKLPRLNDGYYDRGSAHPFEDKGSSKSRDGQYNDKYSRKDGSGMDKHSPRYSNKSSYKDRMERGTKGSRSPEADRRANHHSGHKDGASGSRHSNHGRGGSGSSTAPKDKKADKDPRIEIQKSALRVCHDWSEHLSSSGKRYYYNCKTEVSKWEKPKEWSDEKAVKTEYGRRKEAQLQKQGSADRSKHSSSTSSTTNSHSSRYNQSSDRSGGGDHKQPYKQSSRDTAPSHRTDKYSGNSAQPRRKETVSQSALSALQNPRVLQRSSGDNKHDADRGGDSSSCSNKAVYRDKYGREVRSDRNSGGSNTPRSRQGSVTPSGTDRDGHVNSFRQINDRRPPSHTEDTVNRQQEDMDISPGSTPTEESVARLSNMLPSSSTPQPAPVPNPATVTATSNPVIGAVAALPQLISQIGDNTLRSSQANPQGTSKLNSAIQTLQKLQEALIAQQRHQQQQLATLIQQQLAHNKQLSSVATGGQQPLPSSSAHSRTNGNINSVVASSSGSNPLLSPAVPGHSQGPATVHHNSTAASSHGQHIVTSSPYVHHSSNVNSTAVASNSGASVPHNQALYVVTENGGHSPGAESAGTPLGSPDLNLPDDSTHMESEKDTSQEDVRLGSPALSQSSSQRGVTALATSVTTLQRQESYKLPPSLSNYFKEELIPHVTGWPMEILEKQADQIKNESHTVGNLYSTQVSCELKKARSLVRVSEIQSTLQEQRVLFIRQQIRDLESFRNTNVSFMSPKSGR